MKKRICQQYSLKCKSTLLCFDVITILLFIPRVSLTTWTFFFYRFECCCLSCWFNEQRIFFVFANIDIILLLELDFNTTMPWGISIIIYGYHGINEYLWYWKLYRLLPSFDFKSFNVLFASVLKERRRKFIIPWRMFERIWISFTWNLLFNFSLLLLTSRLSCPSSQKTFIVNSILKIPRVQNEIGWTQKITLDSIPPKGMSFHAQSSWLSFPLKYSTLFEYFPSSEKSFLTN